MNWFMRIFSSTFETHLLLCNRLRKISQPYWSAPVLVSCFLAGLPVIYATASLGLLLGISLGRWVLPVSAVVLFCALYFLHRRVTALRLLGSLLCFALLWMLLAFLSGKLYDFAYDSRTYHPQAVFALFGGWNPYADWNVGEAYPKAHWIISASLLTWTHKIEASFSITAIALAAALSASFTFFAMLRNISKKMRSVLTLVLALNPVTVGNLYNHYLDGALAALLLSFFLYLLCFMKEGKKRHGIYALVLIPLLINLKFTALVYGAILGLTAILDAILTRVPRRRILAFAGMGFLCSILGIAVFGFNPYITNTIQHHNPFYPAIQFKDGQVKDVIGNQAAEWFISRNRYDKMLISLFSKQGAIWNEPSPMPPFSSSPGKSGFREGYGSYFSGAMLLCMTLILGLRNRSAWVILAGVFASAFCTSALWWPRLTPQLWWLPCLFIAFRLERGFNGINERPQRLMTYITIICLLLAMMMRNAHDSKNAVLRSLAFSSFLSALEEQGGWYYTPDDSMTSWKDESATFYSYYRSGLTNVKLPSLDACPAGAECKSFRRRSFEMFGLRFCRPVNGSLNSSSGQTQNLP